MPSSIRHDQSELVREQIAPALVAMLDDTPPCDDAASLEQLAATLLVPLEQPEVPAEVGPIVLEAIAARGDAMAADVLGALTRLAGEPLAGHARGEVERLARDGVVSRLAGDVGTLAVTEAARLEGEGVELIIALLARPGTAELQALVVGIEHAETGGALVDCGLAPPAPPGEARELLDAVDGASAPQPVALDELRAIVLAAARRSIEDEIPLGPEAGPALPIVSRVLTGDPAGLPRPTLLAPWELDDPELFVDAAEDEDGFHEATETLLDELEEHVRAVHPPEHPAWHHGHFVATTMLDWKGGYDDGRLGCWTRVDLAEYMLEWFPRKVSADEETLLAVPDCVCAFLGFLESRGSLSGEPLESLTTACRELAEPFAQEVAAPSSWGLAKSMMMQMHAEGLDPEQEGAVDDWVAEFNARPLEERDAIMGPAARRMTQAAGVHGPPAQRAPPGGKARKRTAQRNARTRNRRG